MRTVHLIDYGSGNLCNVECAFKAVGVRVVVGNTPEFVSQAQLLVLPGVGAFNDCMNSLKSSNLIDPIKSYIHAGGLFLGICVGMQILADSSEEYGHCRGLGIIPGSVVKIRPDMETSNIKIPHISWELLQIQKQSPLLRGVASQEFVYFAHSYQFLVISENEKVAYSNYGNENICGIIQKGNTFGTQFHPEKSGKTGLRILKNFVALANIA